MISLQEARGQRKLWTSDERLGQHVPAGTIFSVVNIEEGSAGTYVYLNYLGREGRQSVATVDCDHRKPCLNEVTEAQMDTWRARRKAWQQAEPGVARSNVAAGAMASGADPELFVEDGGRVVPAWEFLPSKMDAGKAGQSNYPYWDGFQAELHVAPKGCHQILMDGIWTGLKRLKAKMPKGQLSFKTVVTIDEEVLRSAPLQFVQLGCGGSENAYGLHGQLVEDPRGLRWRFSGGHYHMEVQRALMTPRLAERMVRAADMVAGIPSLLMFQHMDSPIRRMYYGLPGEYRMPPHGIEYRFLSSAWMCHPAVAGYTLGLVRLGLKIGLSEMEWMFDYDPEAVPKILLDGDLDAARKHVERNRTIYTQLFEAMAGRSLGVDYPLDRDGTLLKKLVAASVDQLVRPVGDFVPLGSMDENWNLRPEDVWCQTAFSEGKQWQSLILGNSTWMNERQRPLLP